MNALTHEQLEDAKRRFSEKGRIGVSNHELGSLIYEVSESRHEIRRLQKELEDVRRAYDVDLDKFRRIAAIINEGVNYGPTG